MHLELVSTKSANLYILEGMQKSIKPFLKVYDQIHFTLRKPISMVNKIRKETNHEFGFSFNIDGELKGKAIALIDTFEKNISKNEYHDLKAAIQEGLNIVIGNTLGELDQNIDLMSLISPPSFIDLEDNFSIKEKFDLRITLLYSIEFNNKMYNCRLYYLLDKKIYKQVCV